MGIKELIDNHKYISFDIFDTLIKRHVNKPIDIFQLVEVIYKNKYSINIDDFKNRRLYCEKIARQTSKEEDITLDEIYEQLNKYYEKDELIKIKNIEIECELSICTRNDEIIRWFKYAKDKNKCIIIASDMYLDKKSIEKILEKNNISGYNKIFISSEIKKTKYIGSMYKEIINELGCKPNEILHIGDNLIADIRRPASIGISTYYIKGSNEGKLIKRVLKKANKNKTKNKLINNITNNFIENNCSKFNKDTSEYYMFGYKYLGILLYGFLQWIDENCSKNKIEHLYFFSRDGYMLNKAYNEYYMPQNEIKYSYLYVSRRALIVPTIGRDLTMEQLVNLLNIVEKDTVTSFFGKIGLNIEKYNTQIQVCGISKLDLLDYKKNKVKVDKLFSIIKKDIITNAYNEKKKLVKYLEQEKVFDNKNIGVVDLGWRGSLQYSLDKIIKGKDDKITTFGFYLGLSNKSLQFTQDGIDAQGYLFDPDNDELENSVMACVGLIESFFTAPHGSVIGYTPNENGKIICKLDKYEYGDADIRIISEIQKGALDFVKDFSKFNKEMHISIPPIEASYRIIKVLTNPSYKYACKLGDINFSDFGIDFIAKPKKIMKYVIKPKSFFRDLTNSTWKIGFMKRVLKIKLPYLKIYSIMRNMRN